MTPRKFRKKPVVIEAWQFTDDASGTAIVAWIDAWNEMAVEAASHSAALDVIAISTLEGVMHASVGDWVIRGVEGEFYPCKPAIFAATYEPWMGS